MSGAGDWISQACQGSGWTVAGFVPNQYPLLLRVAAPEPAIDDWWSAYRDLFEHVASIGAQHTSVPEHAHFAVWEGHGYETPEEWRQLPRLDLPYRSYYLLSGPVSTVAQINYPGSAEWRNPDLFWPDDRQWFVATDVDFWSLYVAGAQKFIDEITGAFPDGCEFVDFDHQPEMEC